MRHWSIRGFPVARGKVQEGAGLHVTRGPDSAWGIRRAPQGGVQEQCVPGKQHSSVGGMHTGPRDSPAYSGSREEAGLAEHQGVEAGRGRLQSAHGSGSRQALGPYLKGRGSTAKSEEERATVRFR